MRDADTTGSCLYDAGRGAVGGIMTIYVYTYSGIKSPTPQKGYIAYRLMAEKDCGIIKDTGVVVEETEGTWYEASLEAMIKALGTLTDPIGCKWFIYTDSIHFEANWQQAFKWRENGWRKKDGTEYEYADKWDAILKILDECTRPIVSRGDNYYSSELKAAVKRKAA